MDSLPTVSDGRPQTDTEGLLWLPHTRYHSLPKEFQKNFKRLEGMIQCANTIYRGESRIHFFKPKLQEITCSQDCHHALRQRLWKLRSLREKIARGIIRKEAEKVSVLPPANFYAGLDDLGIHEKSFDIELQKQAALWRSMHPEVDQSEPIARQEITQGLNVQMPVRSSNRTGY